MPRAYPGVSGPGFVGRQRELAQLTEAMSEPAAVALVEGEAGVGKSRLVQEFLVSPAAAGQRALVGICPPLDKPFTLGPLVDALRQARVAELPLSPLAGALRPLFPEWAADLPPAPEPIEDAAAVRHRLFRAMAELIGCLDVTVLVVEDVHWADEATLEFLHFFTAHQRSSGLSLLLSFRREDLPAGSSLLKLSSRAPAGTRRLRLVLRPLDVSGTEQLVSSMLGGEHVSDQFASSLHHYTGGLPLAVEETVRLLHDRADLVRRDGQWNRRSLDELQVPATIRDAVQERSERLDRSARRILQAAAVLTEPADAATLAAVAGLDVEQAAHGIAEAVDSGLLREDDTGRMAFRHMLAATAIYDAIPRSTRRILHHRAGVTLESGDSPPLFHLARHYCHAGDTRKWQRYAEQAADLAVTTGDSVAAVTLLNDLLSSAGLPAAERTRLAKKLACVALSSRHTIIELVRLAIRTLSTVLETPELTVTEKAEIRNPLGRLLLQMGKFDAGRAELESAILHLRNPVDAARATIYLGWPLGTSRHVSYYLRWLQRAADLVPASIPLAERIALTGDHATALLLLGQESGWAVAGGMPEEPASAMETKMVADCQLNLAYAAILWGRYPDARRRLQIAERHARKLGYARLIADISVNELHLDWFTGAWDGMDDRVRALAGSGDNAPNHLIDIALLTGLMAAAAGDRQTAEERFGLAIDKTRSSGVHCDMMEPSAGLARLRLAQGRPTDALSATELPAATVAQMGIWVWGSGIVPVRTEVLVAMSRYDEAERLVEAFAQGLHGRTAPGPKAALTLCQAILAEDRGDRARAAVLFSRAARSWQNLPRPYDALLARERQARCLVADGKEDVGLALLTECLRGLRDLGAQADAERLARELPAHGIEVRRPGHRGRRGYGDQLSPREIEVVRLVIAGRTNREIALALNRSHKTVATQVTSAMRKLRVASRTALAVSAIESGVVPLDQRPA